MHIDMSVCPEFARLSCRNTDLSGQARSDTPQQDTHGHTELEGRGGEEEELPGVLPVGVQPRGPVHAPARRLSGKLGPEEGFEPCSWGVGAQVTPWAASLIHFPFHKGMAAKKAIQARRESLAKRDAWGPKVGTAARTSQHGAGIALGPVPGSPCKPAAFLAPFALEVRDVLRCASTPQQGELRWPPSTPRTLLRLRAEGGLERGLGEPQEPQSRSCFRTGVSPQQPLPATLWGWLRARGGRPEDTERVVWSWGSPFCKAWWGTRGVRGREEGRKALGEYFHSQSPKQVSAKHSFWVATG